MKCEEPSKCILRTLGWAKPRTHYRPRHRKTHRGRSGRVSSNGSLYPAAAPRLKDRGLGEVLVGRGRRKQPQGKVIRTDRGKGRSITRVGRKRKRWQDGSVEIGHRQNVAGGLRKSRFTRRRTMNLKLKRFFRRSTADAELAQKLEATPDEGMPTLHAAIEQRRGDSPSPRQLGKRRRVHETVVGEDSLDGLEKLLVDLRYSIPHHSHARKDSPDCGTCYALGIGSKRCPVYSSAISFCSSAALVNNRTGIQLCGRAKRNTRRNKYVARGCIALEEASGRARCRWRSTERQHQSVRQGWPPKLPEKNPLC